MSDQIAPIESLQEPFAIKANSQRSLAAFAPNGNPNDESPASDGATQISAQ